MKIVYIHQYFKTPQQGGAIRSYHVSTGMIDQGHQVVMVTSHNKPHFEIKFIDGVEVHYLPVRYNTNMSKWRRIYAFYKFARKAYKHISKMEHIDLVYASSTPLSTGWVALKLHRYRNLNYYFEVRDLWPEIPIQLGFIRNKKLQQSLRELEADIYTHADKIIALSPGMRDYIEKIISPGKISIVSNIADVNFFQMEHKKIRLQEKYHVKNNFVISYIGAVGWVNGLDHLLYMAEIAQRKGLYQLKFMIVGDGNRISQIKKRASNMELKNFVFIPFANKDQIKEIMNITDAVFTSYRNAACLETSSPNKFFDGLAAGKLQIVNFNGWLRTLIEEKRCGIYADPQNTNDFYHQITPFLQEPTRLIEFQRNARNTAELYFSKEIQVSKITHLIDGKSYFRATTEAVYTPTA